VIGVLGGLILAAAAALGGSPPRAAATRTSSPPQIDGQLNEPVWQQATPLDGWVQKMPEAGKPASERTELRILYDDRAVYLGFRCWDSHARELSPRLGRRDNLPESDWVVFNVDPFHDRRAAYFFMVNVGGTVSDGIVAEGQNDDPNWDGIWEARTSMDERGWTAEVAIPLRTLRFPDQPTQTWGFHVQRYISRLKETDNWHLIPATDPSYVGRFADLVGIEGVHPGLSLQLAPYAAMSVRASFAEASLAPRDHISGDAGFDAKYALTGTLTLDATVNPDFAQVEVDPEVVNLSAYEVFFPEKRQFFLEGLDIFQGVQAVLYTRRIGAPPPAPDPQHGGTVVEVDRLARIAGALKLTGNLRPGTAVGALVAYAEETSATERVGDGPLSPTFALRASAPTFYQAFRLRQVLGAQSTIGVTETSVVRGSGADAHVAALDVDLRGKSDYTFNAVAGWAVTAACDRTLTPSFHGGCDAAVGSAYFGKTGGELRLYESATYLGSDSDLNDLGFLTHKIGNQRIEQGVHVGYYRPTFWRGLRIAFWDLSYTTVWDPNAADERLAAPLVDNRVTLDGFIRLRNQWELGTTVTHYFSRYDDAETRQNPLTRLYHRPASEELWLRVRSDDTRRFWVQLSGYVNYEGSTYVHGGGFQTNLLAGGRLQLGTNFGWQQWFDRPRWVDTGSDGYPLFGTLELDQIDLTLRTTISFARDLTLQVFGQLLRSAQHYPHLFELTAPSTLTPCDSGTACADASAPGVYEADLTSLIVNAVLRWEYHPGSVLFLVYTHNQQAGGRPGRFDFGPALTSLGSTAADNVVALKLSYLWAL
jgi:hypothetical protein